MSLRSAKSAQMEKAQMVAAFLFNMLIYPEVLIGEMCLIFLLTRKSLGQFLYFSPLGEITKEMVEE